MATDTSGPSGIPIQLRSEYEQMVARAAVARRHLDPVPALEIGGRSSHSFVGPPGSVELPRVRLGLDLFDAPPSDRAWTIAHELSHVLRRQEGTRRELTRGPMALLAALLAGAVGAWLLSGLSMLRGAGADAALLFAVGDLTALILGWAILWRIRWEEIETDATAVEVFGEVLSVVGVERLRRSEGRLTSCLPELLRDHPRPAARRRAGLAQRSRGND